MLCSHCGKQVPPESKFCVFCGSALTGSPSPVRQEVPIRQRIPDRPAPQPAGVLPQTPPLRKSHRISCTLSVVLCLTAVLFLILAMNFQDAARNTWELVSPTMMYAVLICMLLGFVAVSLVCQRLRNYWIPAFSSLLLVLMLLFARIQGCVFSGSYTLRNTVIEYVNAQTVEFCNAVWVTALIITVLASFLPAFVDLFRRCAGTVRHNNPYDTIARLHGYYTNGILTKEEFEKAKRDILEKLS